MFEWSFWSNLSVYKTFNPIHDRGRGEGQKAPPTIFSPATFTNVEISPKNFLIFSFNFFATRVKNFKFVPSASPKLLNLDEDRSSKRWFSWSNPYKIELMIISLTEMLELAIFDHMTTHTI